MFEDLIEKIKQDPEWGAIAKERAQKILEHPKIFYCHEEEKGIKAGPGRPKIQVYDLEGLISYLVNALAFLDPVVVETDNTVDLYAENIRICNKLTDFFNTMQQRGMISGKYDPDGIRGYTWPQKVCKIYRAVSDLKKDIKFPARRDLPAARKHLIEGFLKYSPKAPNTLIADKILILLKDIAELPQEELRSGSSLRQQVGNLRKKAESQSNVLAFPKSMET